MILIICHKEGNHLLFFPFLIILNQWKDQAAIGNPIFRFHILFSPINQCLLFHFTSGSHREFDFIAYLIISRIIRTRLSKNSQHIIDTAAITFFWFLNFSVTERTFLLSKTKTVFIREPSLIYRIAFSFFGTFTKVTRLQLFSHDAS